MKSITTTLLQKITAGCLIISIVSWWGIKQLGVEVRMKQSQLDVSTSELRRAELDESYVREALGVASSMNHPIVSIENAYASAMVSIRAGGPSRSVQVTNISIGGKQLDMKGAQLRSLSEPIAVGTTLRIIRMRIQGRYDSLADFLDYIDAIRNSASIIRSWDVKGDTFELEVLALGK